MKDFGEARYILGIKIYRDRSRRLLGLSQNTYTICTQLDLLYALSMTKRYQTNPSEGHWIAVKRSGSS